VAVDRGDEEKEERETRPVHRVTEKRRESHDEYQRFPPVGCAQVKAALRSQL
jgi:hypothetical protein